jgi:hypothetical protein
MGMVAALYLCTSPSTLTQSGLFLFTPRRVSCILNHESNY